MKKFLAGLLLILLWVTAFSISPAAAVPKLAGNWVVTGSFIQPDGTLGIIAMDMTLGASQDPSLFSGFMTGDYPAYQYITLQMDSGNNMHFAMSWQDVNEAQPHTHTWGQGTASNNKIVGSWINDLGYTGNFTAIRQP